MKKVFAVISGIVISLSLSSCSSKEKEKTSTDQYFDQQMEEITDQKAAIKNEYRLRMERKKLQTLWEAYSDCDAVPEPQKKTENCTPAGPQQIVIIDNSNCGKASSAPAKRKAGVIKKTPPQAAPSVDTPKTGNCQNTYRYFDENHILRFSTHDKTEFDQWIVDHGITNLRLEKVTKNQ